VGPLEKQRLAKEYEQERHDSADDGHVADGNVPVVFMKHIPVSQTLQPSDTRDNWLDNHHSGDLVRGVTEETTHHMAQRTTNRGRKIAGSRMRQ